MPAPVQLWLGWGQCQRPPQAGPVCSRAPPVAAARHGTEHVRTAADGVPCTRRPAGRRPAIQCRRAGVATRGELLRTSTRLLQQRMRSAQGRLPVWHGCGCLAVTRPQGFEFRQQDRHGSKNAKKKSSLGLSTVNVKLSNPRWQMLRGDSEPQQSLTAIGKRLPWFLMVREESTPNTTYKHWTVNLFASATLTFKNQNIKAFAAWKRFTE